MKRLNASAAILTIVGGLNWGLASQLPALVRGSEPAPATSVTN